MLGLGRFKLGNFSLLVRFWVLMVALTRIVAQKRRRPVVITIATTTGSIMESAGTQIKAFKAR
jgi:hypothetical protein